MNATLGTLGAWCDGLLRGDPALEIRSVVADSRLVTPGALFVGIQGPNFDGNAFVEDALGRGAAAALVEREDALAGGCPGIVVENSIAALGRLASAYRRTRDIPWIGVTGSNGKTTTRELIAAVLRTRGPVVSSQRNYNNNIGVPLSILSASEEAWAGVIEIGTSAPGEVAQLASILQPTVGVVTNIGSAHLEGLGHLEGVLREKGSLLEALPFDGLAVVPGDVPYHEALMTRVQCRTVTFSIDAPSDLQAEGIELSAGGVRFRAWETGFELPLLGLHNVRNALAAIAVCDHLGVTPAEAAGALATVRGASGRLSPRRFGEVLVLDDTYNANPESLRAAVRVMGGLEAQRRVAIVGPMGELGEASERLHMQSGNDLALAGIDLVLAVGREAVGLAEAASERTARCRVRYFPAVPALLPKLESYIHAGDVVLVKGSRMARMERVVGRLQAIFETGGGGRDA